MNNTSYVYRYRIQYFFLDCSTLYLIMSIHWRIFFYCIFVFVFLNKIAWIFKFLFIKISLFTYLVSIKDITFISIRYCQGKKKIKVLLLIKKKIKTDVCKDLLLIAV